MFDVFFNSATRLHEQGEAFALAVVVRYEAPSSGKAGDKAIIKADGAIEGWIGGGCTQPVVVMEAKKALQDGLPRLIRIAPSTDDATLGIVTYPMTCHSGGALDVYIEPVFPKPHLVVCGHSVVAQTLCRLARAIHYRVTIVAPEAPGGLALEADRVLRTWDLSSIPKTPGAFVVVATQGEGDEEAIEQVLKHDWSYAAFVASRKKSAAVFADLESRGIARSALERLHTPAGLDIKARLPEEIAVSILAEIIQCSRREPAVAAPPSHEAGSLVREEIAVEGMSCAHCVATVEKALGEVAGVRVLSVEIGSAAIRYDPSGVDRRLILEALEKKGYSVAGESLSTVNGL